MQNAPAVSYPVGRSSFYGCLLGLTGLAGVLAGLLWRYQADPSGWRQWLFAAILLGTVLAAILDWKQAPCARLQWDGRGWRLTSSGVALCGRATVHLDLQWCLLLCLRTENGSRSWLWLERRSDVAPWNALRRAAFSGAASDRTATAGVDADQAQVNS